MDKIQIMVNGLPGNVATAIARHAFENKKFELLPFSLTGPEITAHECQIGNFTIELVSREKRSQIIANIKKKYGEFISIDFTHPTAVNDNARFYCKNSLPFVMGTTGGDRQLLLETVAASEIGAVIAPNMAKQIVGFQAMMEYAADTFPDIFKGYSLKIKESHQKTKADTSGTARAMVKYFNKMGIAFSTKDIKKERDPEKQAAVWKIPEKHLSGHAWHTYTLISSDQTVMFEFKHNVNGRDVYAAGTFDAVAFLADKIRKSRAGGKVFSMIDVLKSGNLQ